ncbi:MAG: ribbon-helix-helix protein, CopG family [Nitrospiraceae bacterium]|nr:ribbon-helix-helix protein, CopG family [Nitrospiraceae bacterium]
MPVISVYLKKNDYERIKARSIAEDVPLSKLIRVSIEKYILTEEQKAAREELIHFLKKNLTGSWEDVHKEREEADACRR